MRCISCNKEVTNDYVHFKCPQCGKEIVRCNNCSRSSVRYTCPECEFEGP